MELDVVQGHIHERAGIQVVEVVVRIGVRVEPAAIAAHGKLANEAGSREQVQGVVNRALETRSPSPRRPART